MQTVDVLVVTWILLAGLMGFRRGLASQIVGLAGFALGAVIGARVAPHLLSEGDRSPWQPMAALAGAIAGGLAVQIAASPLAEGLRGRMHGPLATVDRAGGLLSGALLGLLAAWMLAVAALHQPALGMRPTVQRSTILPALVDTLPEERLLSALQQFDRLPVVSGSGGGSLPAPDPALARRPGVRAALAGVVRVEGSACGLRLQGSGWIVRPGIVATNAHVVAGEDDTRVQAGGETLDAIPVYVSPGEDIALLRVPGLDPAPLATRDAPDGAERVVLIGYPGGTRSVTRFAGSAGREVTVLAPDAYGDGLGPRTVLPLKGPLRHGMSGGPVVDGRGRVLAMMFAADEAGDGGYAVPVVEITKALGNTRPRADTGPCVG